MNQSDIVAYRACGMQVLLFGVRSDTHLVSGVSVRSADSYAAGQIPGFEGPSVTRYNPDHVVTVSVFLSFSPGKRWSMSKLAAFNLSGRIDEHRHLLKPPVGNQQVFEDPPAPVA